MANTKVTGDVIANGTISTVHLADDAITAAKLDSTATGITFADLTVDTDTLYVDAANNRVGIGTTNPSYSFHITGSGDTVAAVTAGASSIAALNLGNSTNLADGGIRYDNSADALIFRASNAEKMRIDSSGNVNIGTASTTSSSKVTIQAQGADGSDETALVLRNYSSTPFTGYVTTEYEVGTILMAEISAYRLNSTSGELIFRTKQSGTITEAMRIDSSGLATFKKSGTNARFYDGSTSSTGAIEFGLSDFIFGYDSGVFKHKIWDGADYFNAIEYNGPSHRLILAPSEGKVGIGTTLPSQSLDTTGKIRVRDGGNTTIPSIQMGTSGVDGLSLPTTNTVAFITNSTERMRIESSGYIKTPADKRISVGDWDNSGLTAGAAFGFSVQSTSPGLFLTETDQTSRKGFVAMLGGGMYIGGSVDFIALDANNGNRAVTINSSLNVGIGETSPNGKLDIKQNMTAGTTAAFTNPHLRLSANNTVDSTGFVGMTFATSTANNYGFSWGALRTTSALGGMHLRYHGNSASGTDIFNIDYVGNITVATQKYIRSDSSSGWLTIQGGATFPGGRIDMYGGSNGAAGIEFLTGGATSTPTLRFRIDDSGDAYFINGNVGIGVTSPDSPLHVVGRVNTNRIVSGNLIMGNIRSNLTTTTYLLLVDLNVSAGFSLVGELNAASYTTYNVSRIYVRKNYNATTGAAVITGIAKSGSNLSVVDISHSSGRFIAIKLTGDPEIDVMWTGYRLNNQFNSNGTIKILTSGVTENSVYASY